MISLIPELERRPKAEKENEEGVAQAETAPEEAGFDVDRALDRDGFVQFLARFGDKAPEKLEPHVTQEMFEIFEAKNKVTEDLKQIFTEEIAEKTGLSFSAEELACIDEFIDKKAVESPGEILDYQDQIRQFKELPAEIQKVDQEIEKLAEDGGFNARLEERERQVGVTEKAAGASDFWGKLKMYSLMGLSQGVNVMKHAVSSNPKEVDIGGAVETFYSKKELEAEGIPVTEEGISKRLADLAQAETDIRAEMQGAKKGKMNEIYDMNAKLTAIKESIFSHVELRKEVARISTEKIHKQLNALSSKNGLQSYEDIQKLIDLAASDQGAGLEYIEDPDMLKVQLNDRVEVAVQEKISNAIASLRLGDNAFTRLETQLRNALQAGENGTIAGKGRQESLKFVVDTISDLTDKLPKSPENDAKRILCRRLTDNLRRQTSIPAGSAI